MSRLAHAKRAQRSQTVPKPRDPRLSHWHWLLLLSLLVLAVFLGVSSNEANATRGEAAFWTGFAAERSRSAGIITLPLQLPVPPVRFTERNFQEATLSEQDWHTVIVKRGDNLSSIFLRLGLGAQQLQNVLDLGPPAKTLTQLLPGQEIKLKIDGNEGLEELVYAMADKSLRIQRGALDQFQATIVNHPLETRENYAIGSIDSSLLQAGQDAGLSDTLTLNMAAMFGWDIDFAQDIRRGDSFVALYEEHYLDGEKLRDGAILAAEFINQGKTYRAVRFTHPNGTTSYYTPEGLSMRKAFLRTPVEFTRISSGFTLARYHPILHRMRAHKGVDYAAPMGTPIKAASDGKIDFKGTKGGYGNTIILMHAGKHSTLYAHMSGFARGLKKGDAVRQGQTIGYLGKSGLATGPHLHYEFRVNGVHRDPLKAMLPEAEPIPAEYRTAFNAEAERLAAQMQLLKTTRVVLQGP